MSKSPANESDTILIKTVFEESYALTASVTV
jgi:hypothetical protein